MPKHLIKSKRLIPIILSMAFSAYILSWGLNYISTHDVTDDIVQKQKLKKVLKDKKTNEENLAKTRLPEEKVRKEESNKTNVNKVIVPASPVERFAQIHTLIEKYKSNTAQIKIELERQKNEFNILSANNSQSQQELDQDISCLEESSIKCNLKNESYLLEKGFPKDFGNPKYLKSLVDELKKHKIEIDSSNETAKKSLEKLEAEYKNRSTIETELNTKFEQLNSDQTNEQLLSGLETYLNGI